MGGLKLLHYCITPSVLFLVTRLTRLLLKLQEFFEGTDLFTIQANLIPENASST